MNENLLSLTLVVVVVFLFQFVFLLVLVHRERFGGGLYQRLCRRDQALCPYGEDTGGAQGSLGQAEARGKTETESKGLPI